MGVNIKVVTANREVAIQDHPEFQWLRDHERKPLIMWHLPDAETYTQPGYVYYYIPTKFGKLYWLFHSDDVDLAMRFKLTWA
jgi:hypothetical protein